MSTAIQTSLVESIKDSHDQANQDTATARHAVDIAINSRVTTAALVEKASKLHKNDVRGYLAPVMDGQQVKAYLSLHDAARKRPALQDKRQLFLCGILDKQEPRDVTPQKPRATFISGVSKFLARINKETRKRPVVDWSSSEREQMKDVLKPIVELYREIDTTPIKESL